MTWEDAPNLWTIAEVAGELRRSVKACRNLISAGRFPIPVHARRPMLFRKAAVRAYVEGRAAGSGTPNSTSSIKRRHYFGRAS